MEIQTRVFGASHKQTFRAAAKSILISRIIASSLIPLSVGIMEMLCGIVMMFAVDKHQLAMTL